MTVRGHMWLRWNSIILCKPPKRPAQLLFLDPLSWIRPEPGVINARRLSEARRENQEATQTEGNGKEEQRGDQIWVGMSGGRTAKPVLSKSTLSKQVEIKQAGERELPLPRLSLTMSKRGFRHFLSRKKISQTNLGDPSTRLLS